VRTISGAASVAILIAMWFVVPSPYDPAFNALPKALQVFVDIAIGWTAACGIMLFVISFEIETGRRPRRKS
jgi:hypothetical protein